MEKQNGNLDQRRTIRNLDNNYTRPKHKNNQPTNHKQKGHHFLEDLELEVDLEAELDLERAKRAAEETPGGTCGAGCFGAFLPRAFDLDLEESSSEEAISDTLVYEQQRALPY